MELFEENKRKFGLSKARRLYTSDVLFLFRPSLMKKKGYEIDPCRFHPVAKFIIQLTFSIFLIFIYLFYGYAFYPGRYSHFNKNLEAKNEFGL